MTGKEEIHYLCSTMSQLPVKKTTKTRQETPGTTEPVQQGCRMEGRQRKKPVTFLHISKNKWNWELETKEELPWSSGYDSVLPMQGAWD